MAKIKFSVLMSVYNGDKPNHVKQAIESILKQTIKPNQYVIMIDGLISSELKKLLLFYEREYQIIELHFRKKNLGLGITLNEGINFCKYDYIARMDADDESLPNRFEKQIQYIEKHPEADVVGGNIDEYDETLTTKLATRIVPEDNTKIKKRMKKRNPVNHVTVIYRKEKILSVNSYENFPYFEDYYLWAKLLKNDAVFYNIQEPLVNVRTGLSMYERRGGKKYIKFIIKFEKKIYEIGIINKREFFQNVIERCVGAIIPNKLRGYLYKKILRN